jgi:hypothetical protein
MHQCGLAVNQESGYAIRRGLVEVNYDTVV